MPEANSVLPGTKLHKECDEHYDYLKEAAYAYNYCTQLMANPDWKDKSGWKCELSNADERIYVHSRLDRSMGKVFACTSIIECDRLTLDLLFKELYGVDDYTKWNHEMAETFKLMDISDNCDIVYNSSHDVFGGLVKSRDFVDIRYYTKTDSKFVIVQRGITCPDIPVRKNRIRAKNIVSLMSAEITGDPCKFALTWISRLDLKGMLPTSLIDRTQNHFMQNYIRLLRQRLNGSIKQQQ